MNNKNTDDVHEDAETKEYPAEDHQYGEHGNKEMDDEEG